MSKRTKTKGRANALCLFAHIELILNLCLSDISLGNLLEYVEHPCALTSQEYRRCAQRFKPWRHATLGLLTVLLRTSFTSCVWYGMSGAVDAFAPLPQKRVYLENFFKR